jgi:hypothetical protein
LRARKYKKEFNVGRIKLGRLVTEGNSKLVTVNKVLKAEVHPA